MHGIWKQEGMKEVREQQLCDQRRQIEEKHWLEELEMETMKQKTEGQSNKDTEVAPVDKIVKLGKEGKIREEKAIPEKKDREQHKETWRQDLSKMTEV